MNAAGFLLSPPFVAVSLLGSALAAYAALAVKGPRLSEWIATIGFSSILLAIGRALLPDDGPPSADRILALLLGSWFWAFLGSGWGWRTIRIGRVEDGWARIGILALGWIMVPGIFGCVAAGFFLVSNCFHPFFSFLGIAVAAVLILCVSAILILPAWATYRFLRQRASG